MGKGRDAAEDVKDVAVSRRDRGGPRKFPGCFHEIEERQTVQTTVGGCSRRSGMGTEGGL